MSETPNYIKAEADYIAGMKYKDIAEKYSVSLATVKSWKTRYGWNRDKKGMHTKTQKVCIQNKKDADKIEAIAEDVEQVIANHELTDKQQLFCCIYIKCFNATKAYQKAYKCDYTTALVAGPRLLGNVRVRKEIQRLKQNRLNREMLDESDIFQKYMDIAFSDMKDFVEFGNEEITLEDKQGKEYKVKIPSVNVRNDIEVDGTLISEISKGKDGVKVKLLDRMRALDWLTEHMDIANEEQKERLNLLRQNAIKAEAEARLAKSKADMLEANGKSFELLASLVRAVEDKKDD